MQNNNTALIPVKPSALAAMASRFNMEPATLMNTLKNTVFKGATNEQLAALVIVANEHGLNPFTREIYAFPDKSGGIQAVIGVDGWIRIITTNPGFDGVEFEADKEACTCVMHVKNRQYPVKVTEYLAECRRNTEPWRTYPMRMLRHKALIQAGRVAFGLGSLKDEDDVLVSPSSVTVTRPIFALPALTEAEAPQPDAPSDEEPVINYPAPPTPPQPEPDDTDLGPQPPPTQNYARAVRALLKLGKHTEPELLDLLRTTGRIDDSINSLDEMSIVAGATLKLVHDEWSSFDKPLRKAKQAAR
jgi:phage recombination protein Bet